MFPPTPDTPEHHSKTQSRLNSRSGSNVVSQRSTPSPAHAQASAQLRDAAGGAVRIHVRTPGPSSSPTPEAPNTGARLGLPSPPSAVKSENWENYKLVTFPNGATFNGVPSLEAISHEDQQKFNYTPHMVSGVKLLHENLLPKRPSVGADSILTPAPNAPGQIQLGQMDARVGPTRASSLRPLETRRSRLRSCVHSHAGIPGPSSVRDTSWNFTCHQCQYLLSAAMFSALLVGASAGVIFLYRFVLNSWYDSLEGVLTTQKSSAALFQGGGLGNTAWIPLCVVDCVFWILFGVGTWAIPTITLLHWRKGRSRAIAIVQGLLFAAAIFGYYVILIIADVSSYLRFALLVPVYLLGVGFGMTSQPSNEERVGHLGIHLRGLLLAFIGCIIAYVQFVIAGNLANQPNLEIFKVVAAAILNPMIGEIWDMSCRAVMRPVVLRDNRSLVVIMMPIYYFIHLTSSILLTSIQNMYLVALGTAVVMLLRVIQYYSQGPRDRYYSSCFGIQENGADKKRRLSADLDQLNYFLHLIGTASALLIYAVFDLQAGSDLALSAAIQLAIILGCRAVPWFTILLLNSKLVGNVRRVSLDETRKVGGGIDDALNVEAARGGCECDLLQAFLLRVKVHFTNLANAWCSKMEHFRSLLLFYVVAVTGIVVRIMFDPMQAICAAPAGEGTWAYMPCEAAS